MYIRGVLHVQTYVHTYVRIVKLHLHSAQNPYEWTAAELKSYKYIHSLHLTRCTTINSDTVRKVRGKVQLKGHMRDVKEY